MAVTGLYNSGAQEAMRQQKSHQARGADATAQLASGRSANKASVKPSDQALASQMDSLTKVIDQAAINAKNLSAVIQLGTKTLLNMKNTLATMDALATQASAGEIGTKERAQINDVMSKLRDGLQTAASTTEFNGTKLFTGGAGTASLPADTVVVAQAGTTAAVTDAFAATINADSKGFISGSASSTSVTANGTAYDYSAKIGDQTFTATNETPVGGGKLSLTSTTNPSNVIVLTFAVAVTGTDTLAKANTAFASTMGLDAAGTPATFTSASADKAGLVASASASTTASAGEYSVSADANGVWTLQDSSGRSEVATATATADGAQNVNFSNAGITVAADTGYVATTGFAQIQFDVAQGSAVVMSSQTGAYSTDLTTVSFSGVETNQLGSDDLRLNAISLATADDAAKASTSIKTAMDQINTMYGNLGAAMGNLELKQEVLADMSNELKGAMSGIRDADIPAAITEQKIAEVMSELANIAQGKALAQSQQLLKLAQQA